MTAKSFEESCTPQRHMHYFTRRRDFIDICGGSLANADSLRVTEMKTNWRIKWLRERYGIDGDHLPDADDLWVAISVREFEKVTLHTYCKETFRKCFRVQTYEYDPPSLIELGFVERRFIARPGDDEGPTLRPLADLYEDERGRFLVVNERGEYQTASGGLASAVEIGYTKIERQYRYCIEAVNEALAALDEEEPPEPMPRWEPVVRVKRYGRPPGRPPDKPQKKEGAGTTMTTTTNASRDRSAKESIAADLAQGGFPKTTTITATLGNQYNIDSTTTVLSPPDGPLARPPALPHGVTWSPETLLELMLKLLPVVSSTADEWYEEWYKPADRLITATAKLSPAEAWQRIAWVILYMTTPGSPSWWQRRNRDSPIKPKHVADNFQVQYSDMLRQHWPPPGGMVIEEVNASNVSPLLAPVRRRGMAPVVANALMRCIGEQYPAMSFDVRNVEDGDVTVGLEFEEGQYVTLRDFSDWTEPSSKRRGYIEKAIALAENRARSPVEQ